MSLTNAQYDTLMRVYDRRAQRAHKEQSQHLQEVFDQVPGYREADQQSIDLAARAAILRVSDPQADIAALKAQITQTERFKTQLLLGAGYPEDYLQVRYSCPDCQDTGYINGQKCHCFHQLAVELFYTEPADRHDGIPEDFAHFREDLYPDTPAQPGSGQTAREVMHSTYLACRHFADQFETGECHDHLLLLGGVGLGKTFLSRSIATQLRQSGHTVLYSSSAELFRRLADETFHRGEAGAGDLLMQAEACDLLIIDDLGTELTNAFISSALFDILNRRLSLRKPMVFSTNLSLKELSETYSERCISRILGNFTILPFFGDDIRLRLRLS